MIGIPSSLASNATSLPELTWTGEDGYIYDGAEPDIGIEDDFFEFRIMYQNSSNIDPNWGDNHLHLVIGSDHFEMESIDHTYDDGAIFSLEINGLDPGTHHYHFEALINNVTYRWPHQGLNESVIVNNKPSLLVPNVYGGAFHETTIFPESGTISDTFTFQIVYLDLDNHRPDLTQYQSGVYIDNIYYQMEEITGVGDYFDDDYTDGELFQYSTKLSPGKHQYYFEFIDEFGASETSQLFLGPEVLNGYPDIAVNKIGNTYDIQVTTGGPEAVQWNNLTIKANIENIGNNDTYDSFITKIQLYQLNPATGNFTLHEENNLPCSGLDIGERYSLIYNYTPLSEGIFEARLLIDIENDIVESNNYDPDVNITNNIGYKRFKVGPDLSIRISDIKPHAAYNNEYTYITALIYNSGMTEAVSNNDLTVEFEIPEMSLILETSIPGGAIIPPGGTYLVGVETIIQLNSNISAIPVNVRIDTTNRLIEAAEASGEYNNNEATKIIHIADRRYESVTPSFEPPITLVILIIFMTTILHFILKRQ